MKKANVASKVSTKKVNEVVNNEALSKSKRMIELFELGLEVKAIAEAMSVRYNFAYNVVSNYANMNSVELESVAKESKKDKIIELHLQEKSMKEISIELKTNYNYVFNTIKAYKQSIEHQAN